MIFDSDNWLVVYQYRSKPEGFFPHAKHFRPEFPIKSKDLIQSASKLASEQTAPARMPLDLERAG